MDTPNIFINSQNNNILVSRGSSEESIVSSLAVSATSYPINNIIIADNINPSNDISLITYKLPPESTNSLGTPGELRWDSDYLYVCVSTNMWKKLSLSSIGGQLENVNDIVAQIETINTSISGINTSISGINDQMGDMVLNTDMRLNVTWPVRAVNVGGLITIFDPYTVSTADFYPSWPAGVQEGDLAVFTTVEHQTTAVNIDLSSIVDSILADNPGWEYDHSTLEVALLDIDNRLVGWGTTSSIPDSGQTHGNGGHILTVAIGDFPTITDTNWVLSGSSDYSGFPSYSISSVKAPYKYINDTNVNTHTHTSSQII